jgi:RNA polymerase primary sigma factor
MTRLLNARQRSDWSALDAYLRDLAALPTLTEDEAAALGARAAAGDVAAQEQLVKAHLRMVVRIAHHYAGFGLPLSDLIAEGNLGLIRAAELFDPKFGAKFTTYASIWIKQRIHRAITSQARAVRIPVWRSQRLRKLARLNDELLAQRGRIPTESELAARLGLSEAELAELQGDRIAVLPLDASHDGALALGETLVDENAQHPAVRMTREELTDEIIACLHDLDDRELQILALKFGFQRQDAVSFREMGRRLGFSHEWIRRVAEGAVKKARTAFEQGAHTPALERQRRKARVLERLRAAAHPSPAAA